MYFCSTYKNYIYLVIIFHSLPETWEFLRVVKITEISQGYTYKIVALRLLRLAAEDFLEGW